MQTTEQSFGFNGESDLDLQYGMGLVAPQKVTLYQTCDDVEGTILLLNDDSTKFLNFPNTRCIVQQLVGRIGCIVLHV